MNRDANQCFGSAVTWHRFSSELRLPKNRPLSAGCPSSVWHGGFVNGQDDWAWVGKRGQVRSLESCGGDRTGLIRVHSGSFVVSSSSR